MISLPPDKVAALPVDRLGILLLADIVDAGEWNEYNYLLAARRVYSGDALEAIAEAMAWLRARTFIARDPAKSHEAAILVTRAGRKVAAGGAETLDAAAALHENLHPLIEGEARPQFSVGEYELAVFASMRAIEIRVRNLADMGDEVVGVELMNKAFGSNGVLVDVSTVKGEQEGIRALFAGSYAVFRNPAGHREVNYEDVTEAAEAVQTASLLMRILDRVERRMTSDAAQGS